MIIIIFRIFILNRFVLNPQARSPSDAGQDIAAGQKPPPAGTYKFY